MDEVVFSPRLYIVIADFAESKKCRRFYSKEFFGFW